MVESAAIIASPFGASMLADLGARVIKLEPLDGDPFRVMAFGVGAARCNTDKESMAINLKSAEGQRIAQQLVANADIFIHNYRPGVPQRLGLDYATLSELNPALIHMSITGYGTKGPERHALRLTQYLVLLLVVCSSNLVNCQRHCWISRT